MTWLEEQIQTIEERFGRKLEEEEKAKLKAYYNPDCTNDPEAHDD